MDRRWSTPEDVEADLARAAGGGCGGCGQLNVKVNVHEGCLQYGERPPPPPSLCHNEDADIELQFGPQAAQARNPLPRQEPDLGGITQMLRMIQNYGSDEATSTSANDVILVSKLNPNVKEFTPRHVRVNATTDDVDSDRNTTHPSQGDDKNNSNASETIHEDKYRADREELEAMLKSKIQRPATFSGQDGFQLRQQKYAAVAKLLKLDSTRPPSAVAVQLRTPDYFRSPITTSAAATTPTPTSTAEKRAPSPHEAGECNPLQVEASIHKVTNWFDSKPCVPCPPRVAVVPHLGPVAYKRKQQRSAAASPASLADPKQARGGGGGGGGGSAYVPSSHAAELGLQYAERVTRDACANAKPTNVWEKLEEELKRKDQLLKARGGGAPDSTRF